MSASGYPALTQPQLLSATTRAELEQFISLLQGYLSEQHKEDGSHGDVSADSVDVLGDVTVDGDGAFASDVIAQDGSTVECGLGTLIGFITGVTAPRAVLRLGNHALIQRSRSGAFSGAGGSYQLSIHNTDFDALNAVAQLAGDGGVLTLIDGGSGSVGLALGNTIRPLTAVTVASLVASGKIRWTSRIMPTSITANQNNYNPTGLSAANRVVLTSDANRDITGIAAQEDGRVLWLVNNGTFTITLKSLSGSSSAGNQFATANNADVAIRTNGSVLVHYDASLGGIGFWVVSGV